MQSKEGLKCMLMVESGQELMYSKLWLWGHGLSLLVDQPSGDWLTRYI